MKISPKVIDLLTPAAVYALGILCPEVPSFVWTMLIKAIVAGNITPAHIIDFLASHGVKSYPQDGYPGDPPKVQTPNNLGPQDG
jgi:hypothetical protein